MEPNLIVHYGSAGYLYTKNEIHNILTKLGDQKEEQELLTPGIIGVQTKLPARKAVEEARELYLTDPDRIIATTMWIPADNWTDTNLDAIKRTIREDIRDFLTQDDTYTIEITEHNSPVASEDVIRTITPLLNGKLDYERPKKRLIIELFEKKTMITLALQKDVFVR